jgi:hypothetical protein
MPEEKVVKQRAPKSQQKKPIVREEYRLKSRKYLLEKVYTINTPLGRFALVVDADDLTAAEKSVLFVLAVMCGGDGVDYNPELCYPSNKKVAGGSATSVSVVKKVWNSLQPSPECKGLIERVEIDGRLHTRVLWTKFIPLSYRWKAMLAKEEKRAASPSSEQDIDADAGEIEAAIPTPSAKPSKVIEVDEDEEIISGLDAPLTPKAEPEISNHLRTLLQPLVGIAMTYGAAYSSEFADADHAVIPQYCAQFGMEATHIDGTWRIALPIEEYAALRLSQNSRKVVPVANCQYIAGKLATDIYSVIEHGLATPSWRSSIPKANSPIGLLMAEFDKIRESWTEAGSKTIKPPTDQIIDAVLGVDPLWKPSTEKVEFSLEERRNNFLAWKAEHINDESTMPEEPEMSDAEWRKYWDTSYREHTQGWQALDPELTGIDPHQLIRWAQQDEDFYLYDSELPRRWEPKVALPDEEDPEVALRRKEEEEEDDEAFHAAVKADVLAHQ